jgi:putative addiction module killer protein
MLPLLDVREYLDAVGRSPYAEWFDHLNAPAAAKIATAVIRMSHGNFSNVKGVGNGVYEYKLDFGPGYRIYFGKEGERIILLLGGGEKKRQRTDIQNAVTRWNDYKRRKR